MEQITLSNAKEVLMTNGVLSFEVSEDEDALFKKAKKNTDNFFMLLHVHGGILNRIWIFIKLLIMGPMLQLKNYRLLKGRGPLRSVLDIYESCWKELDVVKSESQGNGKVIIRMFKLS